MQADFDLVFPRLRRSIGGRWMWNHVLRRMAFNRGDHDEETYTDLCRLSDQIENRVAGPGPGATRLAAWSQRVRGWLRHFARRDHFNAYRGAVSRARPSITAAIHQRWPNGYPWICFQPSSRLFTIREKDSQVRLMLPTPMYLFDERGFELVAQVAFLNGKRSELRAATCAPAYQALQAELEALDAEGLAPPLPVSHTRTAAESRSRRA
jgi:hypothetical protein